MLTDLESLAPQQRKRYVAMRDHPGGELSSGAIEESFVDFLVTALEP